MFAKDACVEKILESSNNQNNAKKITKTKADRAFIFFDTSVNMEGFITPATSSYKLFISELVKKTPLISDQQTFHTYLQSITGINVNKIAGVTTNKKFYQCPGSIEAADCHKAKSKLSTVLKASEMQYKIAKNPISIIVTDLFLKVDELVGNDRNKLYQPLAKALKKGDAIGIFGIQSNYGGKIFGICPGMTVSKRSTYSGASSRPFFVILIGNKDIILNFKNIMDEQVLPVIGTEKVEFNLFTNDIIKKPYYGASWPPSNFTTGKGVFKENILEGERTDILQYAIDKKNDPLKISIDLDKIQTPYTLPLSGFSAITQTHIQVGNKGNCDQQWFDLNKSNNITYFAEKADNSNVITFDIFNKKREIQADENGNVSMQLNRNYNYIFQIDFRAENIADNNTLWMEDREWTFSCEQADVITDSENGRTKFPVLNLDSFSDLLKQVQKENFSASSISQLNLAVHLRK
mgnify:CR=1 FL=1